MVTEQGQRELIIKSLEEKRQGFNRFLNRIIRQAEIRQAEERKERLKQSSPGVEQTDLDKEVTALRKAINELNGLIHKEDVENLTTLILRSQVGDLVEHKGDYFTLIENPEQHSQVVPFEEFLRYGYKRVVNTEAQRVIDVGVWEMLFQQKAPEYIGAMSTAKIVGTPFNAAVSRVCEMLVKLRVANTGTHSDVAIRAISSDILGKDYIHPVTKPKI